MNACPYAQAIDMARWTQEDTYKDHFYLRDGMRYDYQKVFNLTDEETANMTYNDAYKYADAIFSQIFEGYSQKIAWNDTQLLYINTTQIWALMSPLTDEARHRYISKLYMHPINKLIELSIVLGGSGDVEQVLEEMGIYRLYSAHDFQIANILY